VDLYSKEIQEEAEEARQRAEDAYDRATQGINDAHVAFDAAQSAMGAAGDNANDIVTIKTDQGRIYTRIESAEQQLSEIDGDDRNLISHNPENWEDGGIGSDGTPISKNRYFRTKDYQMIDGGKEYTLTTYMYDDGIEPSYLIAEIYFYNSFTSLVSRHEVQSVYPDKVTFTIPSNVSFYKIEVAGLFYFGDLSYLDIGSKRKIKLRLGDKATQWTANPQDLGEVANQVVTYVSEFRQTASTLSNRITSSEGDISEVTQLAIGLLERVYDAEGNISSVTQLADVIQSRVENIEDGTASVITQLKDNINARVTKGDVVNQINIDTSGILISGKKLILDGDTTVNGSFKVSNANITSLDAGKITAGVFDAAQASIVNLNANSISGGILTSQNHMTSFNLNNGELNIGPLDNRVRVNNLGLQTLSGGTVTSELNASGHEFYRNGLRIGNIGTNGWFNDNNYRGLAFSLEHNADFMTWAYKKNYGDSNFTTMLSWHKTGDKDYKGFSFSDEVTFKWKTTFIGNIQFRNLGSIESFSNLIEWGTG